MHTYDLGVCVSNPNLMSVGIACGKFVEMLGLRQTDLHPYLKVHVQNFEQDGAHTVTINAPICKNLKNALNRVEASRNESGVPTQSESKLVCTHSMCFWLNKK